MWHPVWIRLEEGSSRPTALHPNEVRAQVLDGLLLRIRSITAAILRTRSGTTWHDVAIDPLMTPEGHLLLRLHVPAQHSTYALCWHGPCLQLASAVQIAACFVPAGASTLSSLASPQQAAQWRLSERILLGQRTFALTVEERLALGIIVDLLSDEQAVEDLWRSLAWACGRVRQGNLAHCQPQFGRVTCLLQWTTSPCGLRCEYRYAGYLNQGRKRIHPFIIDPVFTVWDGILAVRSDPAVPIRIAESLFPSTSDYQ